MPTNRRRRALPRRADLVELDYSKLYHLEHGHPMLDILGGWLDREAFARAWEHHGETILAEWIGSGERPFAWWLLEHKKERPLNPRLSVADAAEYRRMELADHPWWFGYLHTSSWGYGDICGWAQEPEEHYLHRLGLLEPGEWEAVQEHFADGDRIMNPTIWPGED